MTDGRSPDDSRDLLAEEYALGLLDGAEWAAAHALLATDPEFAQKVRAWQTRGADWLFELEPVTPSPQVWERLAASFGEPSRRPASPSSLTERRSDHPGAGVTDLSDFRKWRSRAYLAMAASVVLAVALGMSVLTTGFSPSPDMRDQSIMAQAESNPEAGLNLAAAQIVDGQGNTLLTVLFDPENRELWVNVADIASEGKALELWALDDSGTPLSLGLVEDRGQKRVIDQTLGDILVSDRVIAITLEDRATAPHMAPTGDILGTARLKLL